MYPTIDIGIATIESFTFFRGLMIVVGAGIFLSEWRRRFDQSANGWGLGLVTYTAALIATKAGATGWMAVRPTVLKSIFGVSPFWVREGSPFFFGLLCCLGGTAMILAGLDRSVLSGLDALAPTLAIGQFIYRIGCFLAGDGCYGPATDLPWGVAFPNGSVPVDVPVHPTMLYEGGLMLGVFAVLWHFRRKLHGGAAIALGLALTSFVCLTTHILMMSPPLLFGLTEPQVWSIFIGPTAATWFIVQTWGMIRKRQWTAPSAA